MSIYTLPPPSVAARMSLMYANCFRINGRLVHGSGCTCTSRDKRLWLMNMPGAE